MYRYTQKFASPRASAEIFAGGCGGVVRDEFGGMPVFVVRDFGDGRATVAVFDSAAAKPTQYWRIAWQRVEAFVAETVAIVAAREDAKLARAMQPTAGYKNLLTRTTDTRICHSWWLSDHPATGR